jgi:hypothetical protein
MSQLFGRHPLAVAAVRWTSACPAMVPNFISDLSNVVGRQVPPKTHALWQLQVRIDNLLVLPQPEVVADLIHLASACHILACN